MRYWEIIAEDNVVNLQQHKTDKAFDAYAQALGGMVQGELDFFATGKFAPFAKTYIDHNFNPEYAPIIYIDVSFRDARPVPEARKLRDALKADRFKWTGAPKWANASKNPDGQHNGGWAEKRINLATARGLFEARENSPYGAYQPSRNGMRTSRKNLWNDFGVGFSIIVGGFDSRRGDKYGNDMRQEHHIIDDEKDMKEVSDMFAIIQRSKIKSV